MAFDPLFSGSEPGTHIRGRTALHLWESLERDLAAALHITVVLGVDVVTMTCQGSRSLFIRVSARTAA